MVTLSEINITPLLDLAFVLLIIFIITTPLLTQSIELRLPRGGHSDQRLEAGRSRPPGTGGFCDDHVRSVDVQLKSAATRSYSDHENG